MRGRQVLSATENDYMQTIIEAARAYKWLVYHSHSSLRSEPGFPDLVLVRPPRVLFIEVKTDHAKLRPGYQGKTRWMPGQQEWLIALGACDKVRAMVARPSEWAEIEKALGR